MTIFIFLIEQLPSDTYYLVSWKVYDDDDDDDVKASDLISLSSLFPESGCDRASKEKFLSFQSHLIISFSARKSL